MVTEGSVANLEIQPTLMEKIKEAQHGHPNIDGIKRKVSLGKALEFNVYEQGILWYEERICVPNSV